MIDDRAAGFQTGGDLARENMHPAVIDELMRQRHDLEALEAGDIAGFLADRSG